MNGDAVDNFFLQYGSENRECVFYSRKLQAKKRTQSRVSSFAVFGVIDIRTFHSINKAAL